MIQLSMRCRFLYSFVFFYFFLLLHSLSLFVSAIFITALSCALPPITLYIKLIATSESERKLKERPKFCNIVSIENETKEAEPKILHSDEEKIEEDTEEGTEKEMFEEPVWNSPDYYSSRRVYSPSCSSFGSKSERDWRRTLACKLFEERESSKAEDMDLLWEVHERVSCTPIVENIYNEGMKKDVSLSEFSCENDGERHCCLKAMKLSTKKLDMMRIGSSKLSKITKGLKSKKWTTTKKYS